MRAVFQASLILKDASTCVIFVVYFCIVFLAFPTGLEFFQNSKHKFPLDVLKEKKNPVMFP